VCKSEKVSARQPHVFEKVLKRLKRNSLARNDLQLLQRFGEVEKVEKVLRFYN